MRYFIKIMLPFVMISLFFASCGFDDYDDRTLSPEQDYTMQNVHFESLSYSYLFEEGDELAVTIPVARELKTAATTKQLSFEATDNVFDVPSSISFAAGEDIVYLTVKFPNVVPGKTTSLYLEIVDPEARIYSSKVIYKATIEILYANWNDYATGVYASSFFGSWPQVLQYSPELDRYRFLDLYAEGYNYEFEWEEGEAEIVFGGTPTSSGYYQQATGYVHSTYGMIYSNTDPNVDYSFYDDDTETFTFYRQFVVSEGSFGWHNETFTIE